MEDFRMRDLNLVFFNALFAFLLSALVYQWFRTLFMLS